jgi:hypothetical protein
MGVMEIGSVNHRVTLLYTESEERAVKPGDQGDLLEVRFQKEFDGGVAKRILEVRWDSGMIESLEEGKDFWNVFAQDDDPQTFGSIEFSSPVPKRIRTSVSESDLNRIRHLALDVYSRQAFSKEDSDLTIALALLWHFYVLLHRSGGHYNDALVKEFKSRMATRLPLNEVFQEEQLFDFRELSVPEIISRARRAAHNVNKYNHLERFELSFEESQKDYFWEDDNRIGVDEASELLFVALAEFEDFQAVRISIHDPKRFLINCLERMKFRGKAMYKFACYSSKEEYDSTAEDDAEIFGCVAHSEEEATEIALAKNYWLVKLIRVQELGDFPLK